jgi:hypothetical protein
MYLSIGFEGDKILKRFPNQKVIENFDYKTENEAEDIRLFLNVVQPESCLIINGNSSINFDLSKIKKTESQTVFSKDSAKDINVLVNEEKLMHLEYNDSNQAWSGMVYLNTHEVLMMKKLLNTKSFKHLYFFEVINLIIQNGGVIKAYENINI